MGASNSTETKPADDDSTCIKVNDGGDKATAEVEVTEEDLEKVTCVICQEEFDLELRQPKMLDCHHTFCLQCLKVLRNSYIKLNCLLDSLFF